MSLLSCVCVFICVSVCVGKRVHFSGLDEVSVSVCVVERVFVCVWFD